MQFFSFSYLSSSAIIFYYFRVANEEKNQIPSFSVEGEAESSCRQNGGKIPFQIHRFTWLRVHIFHDTIGLHI
jgi:hypothetical protein